MLKIRDLGVNFIPATMRPPEIGPGAGVDGPGEPRVPYWACEDCVCNNTDRNNTSCNASCDPTNFNDGDENGPEGGGHGKPKYHAGGFTPEAIARIRQQLRARTARHLEN